MLRNTCLPLWVLLGLAGYFSDARAEMRQDSWQHTNSPYFQRPYMWSEEEGKLVGKGRVGAFFTTAAFPEMNTPSENDDFDGDFISSSVIIDFEGQYHFSDHVSFSAMLGYIPQESVAVKRIGTEDVDTGRFHMMPFSLSVQYHPLPYGAIRPYIGVGAYIAPTVFSYDLIDFDTPMGLMARAGFDWWIKEDWGANFDVRYYDMSVDSDLSKFPGIADGTGSIQFNPIVVGVGMNYRFPK